MPDLGDRPRGWHRLGVLLPREVRERVFEPALADAHRRVLLERSGDGFAAAALGTYLGCLPIAVPRLFVSGGRLTRFGRFCVGSVAVIGLLRFAAQAMYAMYP